MRMAGVGLDFSTALTLPEGLIQAPAVVFYPGSSIGNFSPEQACALLQQARTAAQGGALLIGVDLVKPVDILEAAYDDALGITAAFNLNLLNHLNRLLGADFQLREWQHLAVFNPAESLDVLEWVIDDIDLILIMSVNPGFGGQSFIDSALRKIELARKWIDKSGKDIRLEVDGGVKVDNIRRVANAGADTFVAGSAIFGKPDYAAVIQAMRKELSAA
jgi:ribulose-phosphate 3-epimerase